MEKLDIAKTALVVIDLQKGIIAGERKPHASQDVITRAKQLADALRSGGAPIFWVRVTPSPDKKDALTPIADAPMPSGDRPSDWAELVLELGRQDSDFVITKHQWGAFYGTELDLQLRRRGIDTILLCGIATNIGVESTARVAFEYGYNQIFVEDAMSSWTDEHHQGSVQNIFPMIGRVRSTAQVLEMIG